MSVAIVKKERDVVSALKAIYSDSFAYVIISHLHMTTHACLM